LRQSHAGAIVDHARVARDPGPLLDRSPAARSRPARDPCPALQSSNREAYVGWIKRYIFSHGKRHPAEMGAPEVSQFLTSLAVQANGAASTQNQAMNALVCLYRVVLGD